MFFHLAVLSGRASAGNPHAPLVDPAPFVEGVELSQGGLDWKEEQEEEHRADFGLHVNDLRYFVRRP